VIATALLVAAALVDASFGEPPNALHPVVWIGSVIHLGVRASPTAGRVLPFLCGLALAIAIPALSALAAFALLGALHGHPVVSFVVGALLLKSTFSVRALGRAARAVRDALARGDIGRARYDLRSLCSRDASALDEPLLAAATIESIAENASDGFVAPLFYYALFGVPGAVAYRAINTLDSMIGYRGRYEWLGKASARLDDAANYVPARLTAGLLLVAGAVAGHDARGGWRILARDGARTESPNAGRPMSVMAGLLGVALEKPGHYVLGDAREPVVAAKIDDAWRVVRGGAWLAIAAAGAVAGAVHVR
jgi:adenosylcobinamide-phosphate synthase